MATTKQTTKPATVKSAAAKVPTKAAKNTPVSKAKAAPKAAPVAKVETKAKAGAYSLIAGTVAKLTHKGLKQAVAYHVAKGNLIKTADGIKLTAQGATLWNVERVQGNPAEFQAVAALVHGKGEMPKDYARQPATEIGEGMKFPNMLYWGSFSTRNMRVAFAAIWAK